MEQFPDIIVIDDRRVRCLTDRAARWVEEQSSIDMTTHRRATLVVDEDFILDAWMSGLSLRSHSGHSFL